MLALPPIFISGAKKQAQLALQLPDPRAAVGPAEYRSRDAQMWETAFPDPSSIERQLALT